MVAGEGVALADLFAEDGVLEYPFAAAGQPPRLEGRQAIRDHFGASLPSRALFEQDDVEAIVHDTADPEVVVAQIEHHGTSKLTGQPYRLRAIGVIRVRGGETISYQDYGHGCARPSVEQDQVARRRPDPALAPCCPGHWLPGPISAAPDGGSSLRAG